MEDVNNLGILERHKACLVVIDMQEKFRHAIFEFSRTADNVRKLVEAFRILKVPIIVTEQNPEKLGKTVPEISGAFKKFDAIGKMHFSCFGEDKFSKRIKDLSVKDIVICGIETHVCVLKTALDGLKKDYNVHAVADAVSSRKEKDTEIGIKRMMQSGVFLTTTESITFQLTDKAGTDEFRDLMRIIK